MDSKDLLSLYIERILPRLVVSEDCLECQLADNGNGYCYIHVRPNRYAVHRLTYQVYFGEIPGGLSVLHRCDNPRCCNPYHLFAGTQKDNMEDMAAKGRKHKIRLYGEKNPSAKLTWKQVRQIRESSLVQKDLALQFGVSQILIGKIKRKEIWVEA